MALCPMTPLRWAGPSNLTSESFTLVTATSAEGPHPPAGKLLSWRIGGATASTSPPTVSKSELLEITCGSQVPPQAPLPQDGCDFHRKVA